MLRRTLMAIVVLASGLAVMPATSAMAAGVPPTPPAREVDALDRRAFDVSADGRYALTTDGFFGAPDTRVDLVTGAKDAFGFLAVDAHLTDDGSSMIYSPFTAVETIRQYTFASHADVEITLVNAPADWGFSLLDVSGDGRYLALRGASGLFADVGVFVYDTVTHVWRQPDSLMPDFALGTVRQSSEASISSSGRYTAWTTYAEAGARAEVWVYDWTTNTAVNASTRFDGGALSDGSGATLPDISSDGRSVVFRADSSSLVASYSTVRSRVYLRRLDAGQTVMVTEQESVAPPGYFGPSIAGPGSVVGVLEDRPATYPDNVTVNLVAQPVLYYLPSLTNVVLTDPVGATLPNGQTRTLFLSKNGARAVYSTDGDNFAAVTPTDPVGEKISRVFASDIASSLPTRLMDTRPGFATDDGQFQGGGALAAGSTTELVVGGRRGIPTNANAVGLNVTVAGSAAAGFVTIWPCGQTKPLASSLNIPAGGAVANLVISQLGTSSSVCISPSVPVNVIVDAVSVFPNGSAFSPLVPQRMLDTRAIGTTVDHQFEKVGALAPNTDLPLQLSGRINVPSGTVAVALNIAAVGPAANGFVTAYPCGSPVPTASALNFVAGVTRASLTIVPLSAGGQVCLRSNTTLQLLADAVGFFGSGSGYTALNPARLADTRAGKTTVDHLFEATGQQAAGSTMQLTIVGRGGAPGGPSTVSLGVAAVGNTGGGFLTVYPCGLPQPSSSTLNFVAGAASNNHVIVDTGDSGQVCIFTSKATDIVVDVEGILPPPPPG